MPRLLTTFCSSYLEQRVGGCSGFDSSHISAVWLNVKQQKVLTPCQINSLANSCTLLFFQPVRVHFVLLQASSLKIYLSSLRDCLWSKISVLKWPKPAFFTYYFIVPWVLVLTVKLFLNVCFYNYHSVLTENNLCTHFSLEKTQNKTR